MNSRTLVPDLLDGSERLPLYTQIALIRLTFPEMIPLDPAQVGEQLLSKQAALVDLCADLQDRVLDERLRFISYSDMVDLQDFLLAFDNLPLTHRICLAGMTLHLNRALTARTV